MQPVIPSSPVSARFSLVLETPAADPEAAHRHFAAKLSVETDPSDVHADLGKGHTGFVVLDARSAEAYADCHVPGAVSLPYRQISEETTARWTREHVLVVYCWGPGCNAATKAAMRLSALGFRVKEMIGGLEYWRREGYAVEGSLGRDASMYG